ncbi:MULTISPECIES: LacI family DNA-binding transcriptional regulator [Pontibacillus]|uniref:LacI family DNA-binding transcriptional regulator n=1 Tax=Pontibacillus chungwhensis TaxID=265426 RepID=A0ABY8V0S1_9BACI|nr:MULTISPECIES: LacI family DNA-binding transcriptional regulator [Pontibacillus]MCD5322246.1 LacI family transcriptional regulator [Pontibacillus sp. HN14]WIF99540.1 LacI family DNA-binding transcriptional regulator [Pontibacillus chungwhensis]
MVTIYDIAKKTGFSVTTVSKVLNNYSDVSEKTKKAIQAAVEEMDYLPNSHARTLTTKKSWTIGVVFVESLGIGVKHPFFNAVIESFRQYVEVEGYDLLFVSRNISNQRKSYLEHFRYRGVDGVVIVCSTYEDEQVKELMNDSIPTVVIDMSSDQSSVVYSDNYEGSKLAVQHLYDLGHRRIAHIAGHESTFAGEQRKKGFLQAVKALNLGLPNEYVVNGDYFSIEGGQKAMRSLLELEERPTAVYAAGDNLALGAINEIHEHNLRVPDDLSVVGFDDIELAKYTYPALTTIRQRTDQIGEESAKLLLKQIDCKDKYIGCIQVPVELIVRKSSGPVA